MKPRLVKRQGSWHNNWYEKDLILLPGFCMEHETQSPDQGRGQEERGRQSAALPLMVWVLGIHLECLCPETTLANRKKKKNARGNLTLL